MPEKNEAKIYHFPQKPKGDSHALKTVKKVLEKLSDNDAGEALDWLITIDFNRRFDILQ